MKFMNRKIKDNIQNWKKVKQIKDEKLRSKSKRCDLVRLMKAY